MISINSPFSIINSSMTSFFELLAIAAILIGTFFSVVGAMGAWRLPDVYTRLHATGKVGVFGVVLLLVAAIFVTPLGWAKGSLLIVMLMIAGPVVTHALASAAHRLHIPMKGDRRNDLDGKVEGM